MMLLRRRFVTLFGFCVCISAIVPVQWAYAHKSVSVFVISAYGPELYFERSSEKNMNDVPPNLYIQDQARGLWGTFDDFNTKDQYHQVYYQIYNYDKRGGSWPHGQWIGSLSYNNPTSHAHAFIDLYIGDHTLHHFELPYRINGANTYYCDLTLKPHNSSIDCFKY